MGNLACDLLTQGKTVLFSFEEAIGKKYKLITSFSGGARGIKRLTAVRLS